MAVITTGAHPKALWPGVHAFFGRTYNKHPLVCTQLFGVKSSKKAYEEDVRVTGFGMVPVKPEGSSVSYQAESQADTTRYTHVTYASGYIVTEEEIDDSLYDVVSKRRSESLAFSMRTTKEVVAANVFNRAETAGFTGGDGQTLLSVSHPSTAGSQSNRLATAADFSEAALEDLLIQIKNAENYMGLPIAIRAEKLAVPPALEFEAHRVLNSTLRVDTANNDINAVKSMGMLPGGVICNPYFTDEDAWFLLTDVPAGLTCFMRKERRFEMDNDFDTSNAKAKASERYSFGWSDWLGCFGSMGA